MKKIFLVLILILLVSPCAFSQEETSSKWNKFLHKVTLTPEPVPAIQTVPSSEEAALLYSNNQIDEALEAFLAIPEAQRTSQDWVLIGNIMQDKGRNSDAVFMYKRASLICPNYYKPYYNLANIYLEEEKPHMAIENYKKAIKYKDDFSYAHYNLGCAYLRLGELRKAKYSFLRAIEHKNSEPDFYYNAAYVYKKLNKEKTSKKYLESYEKALEIEANN